MSTESVVRRLYVPPFVAAAAGVVVGLELMSVLLYFGLTAAEVTSWRHVLYPFVWINLGVWAAWRVDVPSAEGRQKALAGGVAALYFLVLMYFAGLVGTVAGGVVEVPALMVGYVLHSGHAVEPGVTVSWLSPGWGPVLQATDGFMYVKFVPFMTVGYAALAYLVYAGLLETARSVAAGAFGLVSCVGCTWPIAASLLAGVAGGLQTGSTFYQYSYGLSTVVFVAAVLVLYYRPFS